MRAVALQVWSDPMNRTAESAPTSLAKISGGRAESIRSPRCSGDGEPAVDFPAYLRDLNLAQRAAVEYGVSNSLDASIAGPLLVIAGAGTGKTNTLAHRVAH